jgi:glycosyltransferase involved in cell wall biosynthesis
MKIKKWSVSVGIPAYNEESTIVALLIDVFSQKRRNFFLEQVIVYSDNGTDNTAKIVTELRKKHPELVLIKGRIRKGKYVRVNQLLNRCKSDMMLILDADIAIVGDNFIEKLITVLKKDKQSVMVSTCNTLLRPKTFIGKLLHTHFVVWEFVRLSLPNHNNAANFYGTATAYRGSFARGLIIPSTISDPHLFLYLSANKINGFRYCPDAKVLQWPIMTIKDFKKLLQRSIGKKDPEIERIFQVKTDEIYYFPLRYKMIGFLKALWWQPFYTPLAFLVITILVKFCLAGEANISSVWDITESTKKVLPVLQTEELS